MITVTAHWSDWQFSERPANNKTVHPTPGRDRPLVVHCTSPYTAAVITEAFTKIGCTVIREEA
jgi:rhodanese-related sulfurtransferase